MGFFACNSFHKYCFSSGCLMFVGSFWKVGRCLKTILLGGFDHSPFFHPSTEKPKLTSMFQLPIRIIYNYFSLQHITFSGGRPHVVRAAGAGSLRKCPRRPGDVPGAHALLWQQDGTVEIGLQSDMENM